VTGNQQPKQLTPELIQRILLAYGEAELAKDELLVKEMLEAARGGGGGTVLDGEALLDAIPRNEHGAGVANIEETDAAAPTTHTNSTTTTTNPVLLLNVETFAEALTHDIRLYDIRNEVRLATNLEDVFVASSKETENENEEIVYKSAELKINNCTDDNTSGGEEELECKPLVTRKNTFPSIDITAETYKSKSLTVLLWATILVTYFA